MARYCPVGDGAFEDWVRTCPECGRTLVSEPPEDSELDTGAGDDTPIVWLVTAANEVEAMMWADVIRGQKIPVLLRAGGPGAGAWASSATFEHRLYVREPDLPAARAVLDSIITPSFPSELRPRRRAPRVHRRSLHKAG
jgi:hypothetical protein